MLRSWLARWRKLGRIQTQFRFTKVSHRRSALGMQPVRVEGLEDRTLLAAITVNSLADAPIAADGKLTLREAIQAANTGTTVGDATGSMGIDNITFSVSGKIALADIADFGDYLITEDLTIDGGGNITIDGQGLNRIFDIENAGAVTLSGLTLTGGDGTSDSNGNTSNDGRGGAIFNVGTNLTLNNMTIWGSSATDGGGFYNSGTATIQAGSILTGNTAKSSGGGIYNIGGTLLVDNSTIGTNTANNGGGITNTSGATATFQGGSMISGNSASNQGGGIYNNSQLLVIGSTIHANTAVIGGGVYTQFDASRSAT
ncbi:MAG: CSLREA domain-containing protein, partial [Planctomycetaceae bacterium]|nr:CSLREA domain-containing protein [Planctomycetaceae bacterium]